MHHPVGRTIRRHPFVDCITETNIPLGWKPLNLEQYNGTIDPHEHLDAFLTQTNLYTNDDTILCCVFLSSLKGAILIWYGGIPPRSIDSFDTLVERVSRQCAIIRSHRMTSVALVNVRQADDESLRKLMNKFGWTTVQIQNLNPEVALHSMLLALHLDKFVDSLCQKPSGTIDELCERDEGYI